MTKRQQERNDRWYRAVRERSVATCELKAILKRDDYYAWELAEACEKVAMAYKKLDRMAMPKYD